MKVADVEKYLDERIPFSTAESWDNVGLLVGKREREISGIMLALDITEAVVDEAKENNCNLIISHHPVIFNSLAHVIDDGAGEGVICKLIRENMSAICIHTPLDFCDGGTNDALAETCGLEDPQKCCQAENGLFFGRIGRVKAKTLTEYITSVKSRLSAPTVLYHELHNSTNTVMTVAGHGGDQVALAKTLGADTLVTGEAKHSEFVAATNAGINLVVVGHYHSEKGGLKHIENLLLERFEGVKIVYAKSLDSMYKGA